MRILPFRKQSCIRALHVTLLSFLYLSPSVAQMSVQGGWGDFGIQNSDTTICMDCKELVTNNRSKLFYADLRQSFDISMKMCFHTLLTEQAFLCKEGLKDELFADLTIGYDPGSEQIFAEVKDGDGKLHRIVAGNKVTKGKWFDVRVISAYNEKKQQSELVLTVKAEDNGYKESKSVTYAGFALPYHVTRWVVGHGFPGGYPNSLQVRNGEIRNLVIRGTGKKRIQGQNPIFTDRFTADPACTVIGDKIYAYVGEDKATVGGWFSMPHWIVYSSSDMMNWESHGSVLKAADFPHASPNGAWAGQVVEKEGKFYYYITLDDIRNGKHMIDVAVSDSPTGPFVPAHKDGTPLITDDMTPDSHRSNSDIDPTVLIDDDGTAWMAWGNGDCYIVRLKSNMTELDGEILHLGLRNYSEGPWLFKRKGIYYNVYAADAPGVQSEQIAYSTATSLTGPWTYRGLLTSSAKYGFTIHPSVNEFKGKWYFFYHDGSYTLNGEPGGDCRRQVCVENMKFNKDGTIQPITLTEKGISH
jgi:hypothetical protein